MLAVDNIEVLKSNGFEISVDPDCAYGVHKKIKLVAQPMSKSTVFNVKGACWKDVCDTSLPSTVQISKNSSIS
jgi:hypothetical protein